MKEPFLKKAIFKTEVKILPQFAKIYKIFWRWYNWINSLSSISYLKLLEVSFILKGFVINSQTKKLWLGLQKV